MKQVKNIGTLKDVTEQLESLTLEKLFQELVNYAQNRMKGDDIIKAEEIVGDVFEKTILGVRKWNKTYPFKSFLFLSVKSLVSQYNNHFGDKYMNFNYDFEIEELSDSDFNQSEIEEDLKNKISKKLKDNIPPPDEIEEMVFECWMDGMKKSKEIADFWDIDIKEIYKATKRLERKLGPIRETLTSESHE